MDTITPDQRSKNMQKIRSKNTTPELIIRRFLFRQGLRFRLHVKELPGKPDIVLPKYRAVIFVHGCFWHQHPGCKQASSPKSNSDYWKNKLSANQARDKKHTEALAQSGWRVFTIWECEVESKDQTKLFILVKQIKEHQQI